MKHISKYIAGLSLVALVSSCSLNKEPHNGIKDEDILNDETKWPAATAGNYSLLKEQNFTRNYFQMGEYPSDDIALSGATTDPLFYSYTYGHLVNQGNGNQIWRMGYKAIGGCNRLMAVMPEGKSAAINQLIGENLFIRAFVHFSLVRTFGRPYSQSPETNLGIPVITKYDVTELPKRNTVKEVYAQIIADLTRARRLMNNDNTNSYASKDAAMALLARAYLYRGQNDSARIFADSVIRGGRHPLVPTSDLPTYYTKGNEGNKETIFAIRHMVSDDRDWSSIGSMYYMSPGGLGYGEAYASESYRKLLDKYPTDVRHAFVQPVYLKNQFGKDSVNPTTGKKVLATRGKENNKVEKWYILKYSNQDNIPTLSSPVVLRAAEMYLIRAEAYAKEGNKELALEDVNTIRMRAGLSGDALFSTSDLKGYASVLDVVLDERRLELAFETHRVFDLFRNNKNIFRDYNGVHPDHPQTIRYTDARVVHYIPEQEILLNRNLEQNP
ncbi:RagB/SusD family nutrient uptake outer membrane protein [Chitinophaga nivalis]|uniref:RagB/SusD family nutrient uptake outer membrane protein n=1 Tax=Chitinophaga nivalis TaxID=2991709 RepID=A0ABT3IVP9_9BACT|nr:RagB/SusD family nutrient uptake outer membrane protein [Chitinophaga nivalis]MCW3462291.1 RagB/SusD family nutrient uptake outer membrane protein [Chitinophaga nivalis]MCW3488018.1 RagB/SusD family nutrient uptake outer membrane protein [Chitinophaga nivalis]